YLRDARELQELFGQIAEVLDSARNVTESHADLLEHAEFAACDVTGRDIKAAAVHTEYVREIADRLMQAALSATLHPDAGTVATAMRTLVFTITSYNRLAMALIGLETMQIGTVPAAGGDAA